MGAPLELGDSTFAYFIIGTDQNGNPQDEQVLYWTHGPIVLSVRMFGPTGSTSMDQVVALAQSVEASYQAGQPTPAAPASPIER